METPNTFERTIENVRLNNLLLNQLCANCEALGKEEPKDSDIPWESDPAVLDHQHKYLQRQGYTYEPAGE